MEAYWPARGKLAIAAADVANYMQLYDAVRSDHKQIRVGRTHPRHAYREQVNDDSLGVGFCRALG